MNQKQRDKLSKIKEQIQAILDEEEEKLDNLPENLRYSGPGDKIEESIDWLEEAIGCLNEVGA
jgi:vacuolar-type H+-ATPase subunit E/Vma4